MSEVICVIVYWELVCLVGWGVGWACRCRKLKMKHKVRELDVMDMKLGFQLNWVENILNPNQIPAPSEKPCCCQYVSSDFG